MCGSVPAALLRDAHLGTPARLPVWPGGGPGDRPGRPCSGCWGARVSGAPAPPPALTVCGARRPPREAPALQGPRLAFCPLWLYVVELCPLSVEHRVGPVCPVRYEV